MTGTEFLERFAGPIATVIAAVAAVTVTLILGLVQSRIARSQANTAEAQRQIAKAQLDIAYDRLKQYVFDKRYEVYVAAYKLIMNGSDPSPPDPKDSEMEGLRLKLGEALFLFPPDTRDFCERIQKAAYEAAYKIFLQTEDGRREARLTLVGLRDELPKRFERDLSLEQLTQKIGVDEGYSYHKRYSHYTWRPGD
jgi:hypothetical protein